MVAFFRPSLCTQLLVSAPRMVSFFQVLNLSVFSAVRWTVGESKSPLRCRHGRYVHELRHNQPARHARLAWHYCTCHRRYAWQPEEAQACTDRPKWKAAVGHEIETLEHAKTRTMVLHPEGKNIAGVKWVSWAQEAMVCFSSVVRICSLSSICGIMLMIHRHIKQRKQRNGEFFR